MSDNRTFENHEQRIQFLEQQRKITINRIRELQERPDQATALIICVFIVAVAAVIAFAIWMVAK